jgi:hypothetical protein
MSSFTYCNSKELENSKRWIEHLDAKVDTCKEIYERCIANKLGNCHLILNDYNATLSLKKNIYDISENIQLKCKIEEEAMKKLGIK